MQEHFSSRPAVYVGDVGTGKYFIACGVKFHFAQAAKGINIGVVL